MYLITALFVVVFVSSAMADTPVNCTYDDIVGTWLFYEGPRGHDNSIECWRSSLYNMMKPMTVQLIYPNKAVDSKGNHGSWTMVYNQGFEVKINYRKYYAFSNFTTDTDGTVTSYCHQLLPGWSHDIYARDWSCYYGMKFGPAISIPKPKVSIKPESAIRTKFATANFESMQYKTNPEFIAKINEKQKSWKAKTYPEFEGKSFSQLVKRMGGEKSRIGHRVGTLSPTAELKKMSDGLPENFDWRNYYGKNYVTPVRDQGHCGSCFAFSSMAMLEARTLVLTNSSEYHVFSPMDIVGCTHYSQGCAGGFPYLIGGKYAEDYGVVEESCNPYPNPVPEDTFCQTSPSCRRYYGTKYYYVGGYYGACNEEAMKVELIKNGPMAVSFEVYDDFMHYAGGVYHFTGLSDDKNPINRFNPFHITNHAVTLVGYGTDSQTKEPYWLIKNSWGTGWGEDGYFRILRGVNECSVESEAVAVTPIPTY